MKYKQGVAKTTKVINYASKALLPATTVGIAATKKVQKAQAKKETAAQPDYMSLPKSPDMIQKSSGTSKLVMGAEKMLVKQGLKMAERKAEQKLDKRFGKSRGYRIGKAVLKGALAASTGNYGAVVNQGANIYYEADPNKKRAARVREGVQGATAIYSSLRSGNLTGAIRGATDVYSAIDDNRSRVAQFQAFNQQYLAPTLDLTDSITGFDAKASKASTKIQKANVSGK
jgi:hypothetical protein